MNKHMKNKGPCRRQGQGKNRRNIPVFGQPRVDRMRHWTAVISVYDISAKEVHNLSYIKDMQSCIDAPDGMRAREALRKFEVFNFNF